MKSNTINGINKIREAYNNNKLVIFIGAGVSVNSGLPSWFELIEKFAIDLGTELKGNSFDELSKIPQMYLNENGIENYHLFVKKIFSIDAKPNDLHKILFEFEPNHIITTNFDELLERYTENERILYDCVAKNEDLPKIHTSHLIIKMHGDINNNNFVLSTNDYSDYQTNFSRVSDYVKSLFSTNVILFVGFSAEDPNFKGLFRDVCRTLKFTNNSYLLEVSKSYDQHDHLYYENQGINILYYKDIENELDKLEYKGNLDKQLGVILYKFLKFIKDFDLYFLDIIDRTYHNFQSIKDLNYIFPRILGEIISPEIFVRAEDPQYLMSKNTELNEYLSKIYTDKEFLKKELNYRKDKLRFILTILNKGKVKGIGIVTEEPTWVVYELNKERKNVHDELINDYLVFDISGITEKLKHIKYETEIDKLKECYYRVFINDTFEAYDLMKNTSFEYFRSKKLTLFLLSEFNRVQFRGLLLNASFGKDVNFSEVMKIVENELNDINIEENYKILSKKEFSNLKFLNYYFQFDFIFPLLVELNNVITSVYKYKEDYENGRILSTFSPHAVMRKVNELWLFLNRNYLLIDYFSEIKEIYEKYCEIILVIYSLKVKYAKDGLVLTPIPYAKLFSIHQIDYFVFHLIIKNFNEDLLLTVLKKNEIDLLNVKNETKDKILLSFTNIVNHWSKDFRGGGIRRFNNTIVLLALIKVEKSDFVLILSSMLKIMDWQFSHRVEKSIYFFINKQYKLNKDVISLKVLEDFYIGYLNKVIDNAVEHDFYTKYLLESTISIISQLDSSYQIENELSNKLLKLIFSTNEKLKDSSKDKFVTETKNRNFFDLIDYIMVPLWDYFDKHQIGRLREYIESNTELYWKLNDHYWIPLYLQLISDKRIEVTTSDIERLVKFLKIQNSEKRNTQKRSDFLESSLLTLSDILNLKLLKAELIEYCIIELKGISNCFDFKMNIENFDMKNFDINWLGLLTNDEHLKLNITHRSEVIKLIKENSNLCRKLKYDSIIFKYYLS